MPSLHMLAGANSDTKRNTPPLEGGAIWSTEGSSPPPRTGEPMHTRIAQDEQCATAAMKRDREGTETLTAKISREIHRNLSTQGRQIYERYTQANAIGFVDYVVERCPFRIQTTRADNGHEFQSAVSQEVLRKNDIVTDRRRPCLRRVGIPPSAAPFTEIPHSV